MSTLETALNISSLGFPVFPCNLKNKRPLTDHGFKDASEDSQKIKEWWTEYPDALIAMPTGTPSRYSVIDLDPIDGRIAELPDGIAPSNLCLDTRRNGKHHYYKHVDGVKNSASKVSKGVDIRGEGGYVILWNPAEFLEFHEQARQLQSFPTDIIPPKEEKPLTVDSTGSEGMLFTEGSRNDSLFRFGCSARAQGSTDAEINALLEAANASRCNPPLPASEVQAIIKQVCKHARGTPYADLVRDWDNKNDYNKRAIDWDTPVNDDEDDINDNHTTQDLKDLVLEVLEKARRPMRTRAIQNSVEKMIGRRIDKGNFSNRVLIPLQEEKMIFRQGDKRTSPWGLAPLISIKPVSILDGLDSNSEYEKLVPILPLLNHDMKTNPHQMDGGLAKGDTMLFNAKTGQGKSHFYLTCALKAAELNQRVLYVDMENMPNRLKARLGKMLTGRALGNAELRHTLNRLDGKLDFASFGQHGLITTELCREAFRGYDLVVIDYLKLDKFQIGQAASMMNASPGSAILQDLSNLAREENFTLLTGTQITSIDYRSKQIMYRGGPGWVEVAGDVWSQIDFGVVDPNGTCEGKIKIVKARDRLIPSGRVIKFRTNPNTNNWQIIVEEEEEKA